MSLHSRGSAAREISKVATACRSAMGSSIAAGVEALARLAGARMNRSILDVLVDEDEVLAVAWSPTFAMDFPDPALWRAPHDGVISDALRPHKRGLHRSRP